MTYLNRIENGIGFLILRDCDSEFACTTSWFNLAEVVW